MKDTTLDYSRYFWQGEKVRLRPLRIEDAEQGFIDSFDSPSRQFLELGIELPTSIELQSSTPTTPPVAQAVRLLSRDKIDKQEKGV